MLKYFDFWYALEVTKQAQSILEGVSMETSKARSLFQLKKNVKTRTRKDFSNTSNTW